ncbi:hypothetical protein KEM52_004963, partial [Ascosphaera acerosa]
MAEGSVAPSSSCAATCEKGMDSATAAAPAPATATAATTETATATATATPTTLATAPTPAPASMSTPPSAPPTHPLPVLGMHLAASAGSGGSNTGGGAYSKRNNGRSGGRYSNSSWGGRRKRDSGNGSGSGGGSGGGGGGGGGGSGCSSIGGTASRSSYDSPGVFSPPAFRHHPHPHPGHMGHSRFPSDTPPGSRPHAHRPWNRSGGSHQFSPHYNYNHNHGHGHHQPQPHPQPHPLSFMFSLAQSQSQPQSQSQLQHRSGELGPFPQDFASPALHSAPGLRPGANLGPGPASASASASGPRLGPGPGPGPGPGLGLALGPGHPASQPADPSSCLPLHSPRPPHPQPSPGSLHTPGLPDLTMPGPINMNLNMNLGLPPFTSEHGLTYLAPQAYGFDATAFPYGHPYGGYMPDMPFTPNPAAAPMPSMAAAQQTQSPQAHYRGLSAANVAAAPFIPGKSSFPPAPTPLAGQAHMQPPAPASVPLGQMPGAPTPLARTSSQMSHTGGDQRGAAPATGTTPGAPNAPIVPVPVSVPTMPIVPVPTPGAAGAPLAQPPSGPVIGSP